MESPITKSIGGTEFLHALGIVHGHDRLTDDMAKKVGHKLVEYLMESDHQGWEGYTLVEQASVATFLEDFLKTVRD